MNTKPASAFVRYTKAEFEAALAQAVRKIVDKHGFPDHTSDNPEAIRIYPEKLKGGQEHKYRVYTGKGQVYVKIESSICPISKESRDHGEDAIRVNLIDGALQNAKGDDQAVKKKQAHVKRITTWAKNLEKRLEELIMEARELPECEICGSFKVEREGKFGAFISCMNFRAHPPKKIEAQRPNGPEYFRTR